MSLRGMFFKFLAETKKSAQVASCPYILVFDNMFVLIDIFEESSKKNLKQFFFLDKKQFH